MQNALKRGKNMAHRIELNQLGLGGGLAVIVAFGAVIFMGTQTQVSRGVVNDTILVVAGETYSTHVQCGETNSVAPSLLKAFVGLHNGERVVIKGYNRRDAQNALATNFPDCKIGSLSRSKRALWKSMI
jgi:hypothetical protein